MMSPIYNNSSASVLPKFTIKEEYNGNVKGHFLQMMPDDLKADIPLQGLLFRED